MINNIEITKKDFSKITKNISYILIIISIFCFVTEFYKDNNDLGLLIVFCLLLAYTTGFFLYVNKAIKYIKTRSYTSNVINLRTILGKMSILFFSISVLSIIFLNTISYNGICHNFMSGSNPCSYYIYSVESDASLPLGLVLIISIPALFIMYITGIIFQNRLSKIMKQRD